MYNGLNKSGIICRKGDDFIILLAIDPSISSSGYCIIKDNELIKYGKVSTNKKDFKSEDDRLNHISNIFSKIANEYKVDEVIMESQFIGGNAKTGMVLKKLIGALCRTFKDIPHVSYVLPSQWRKSLLHKNKAVKKEDVVEYIRNNIIDLGELKSTGVKKNEDIYESIGVAYGYLNDRENIIKNNLY